MKHLVILMTFLGASTFSVIAQTPIAVGNAAAHVGDTVKICDRIASTNGAQFADAKPTILLMGLTDSDKQVAIIVKPEIRKRFDYRPEKDLLNRNICVTGKLELIDGKLQITINKQEDIDVQK